MDRGCRNQQVATMNVIKHLSLAFAVALAGLAQAAPAAAATTTRMAVVTAQAKLKRGEASALLRYHGSRAADCPGNT
jgi:uncharacterized protein (DUF2141 family)